MPALFPKFVGIKSCFVLPHAINPVGLSFRRIGIIPVYITENAMPYSDIFALDA